MAFVHYTEASGGLPNSGRLSGTAGDLVGVLDVVLVAAGWAIEYTATNQRVYRPATGNRFRLAVLDDGTTSGSATTATVRGCENASATTTLTDPFPLVASVSNANSCWVKSSVASTTGRAFDIWASDTWIIYMVNYNGSANTWELMFFGDAPSNLPGDVYNTLIMARNTNVVNTTGMSLSASTFSGNSRTWWARSYDGTVKSTQASVVGYPATQFGGITSCPTAQSGPTTKIDREKACFCDLGSQTTTASSTLGVVRRAYFPNLWLPMHGGAGSLNARDTFTDSAYNTRFSVSATFQAMVSISSQFVIIESTNTWSLPNG